MEDESFKVNANLMGNTGRGSSTLGNSPTQIPWQGILPIAFPTPNPPATYYDTMAQDIFDFRSKFRSSLFLDYRGLNQVTKNASTVDFSGLAEAEKFEATIFSGAMNLSRSGSKRVNLNKVVADENPDPANPSAPSVATAQTEIRKQLDEIIKTITFHLPNFAQRFYRTGIDKNSLDVPDTATPSHRAIYLNKIAANIRDYIDTDSQPTLINNDAGKTVRIGTIPAHPVETSGGGTAGPSEVVAIGKERVPFVQEYVLRVREVAFSPRLGASATYTISIDHYVEFWNTSNRDIPLTDLGPNPFLLIADQPGWDAGGLTDIPAGASRDIKLPLNSAKNSASSAPLVSFPAGSVTVITTDPQPLSAQGSSTPVQTGPLTPDLTRVYYIPITPVSLRTYSGQTQKKSNSELRLNLIPRTTTQTDYETEIVLGNDLGILESAWGAGAIGSTISINIDNATPAENRLDNTKYHFRGAWIKGNNATSPLATTGDPRTNAEQINFDLNGAGASNDKTRYFDSGIDSGHIPANSSLGAPNSFNVNPATWPDPSSSAQSATAAPTVIANTNLTLIGQLGDIFDSVRTKGDSNNILLSRSGGRTFKVGQPERFDSTINPGGLWDGDSNSASREWTAWRLTDVFSTSDLVQLDGRVNINGVSRDGGAAVKAALYGYSFQINPNSDPQLASQSLDNNSVDSLIAQLNARLSNEPGIYPQFATTAGPLFERGEVSEMPIFNTTTSTGTSGSATYYLASGVDTKTVYDRGREELFRRVAELITTRGNIFTVYAVGQSLNPQSAGTPVATATSQLKVTFRIDPVWNAGTPADPFDPTTNTRFIKPDHYAIKILCAGE
jgi:hypothetical protein